MQDVSIFALLARLVLSLGVVLALMYVVARLLARSNGGRKIARSAKPVPIQVMARQSLSKNTSVAVVHAGGKALIVGVTDSQVTLLGESVLEEVAEPDDVEDPAPTITAAARTRSPWAMPSRNGSAAASTPWMAMLETLRERTARRS
jgi:flagellar protein FliO/FliZ